MDPNENEINIGGGDNLPALPRVSVLYSRFQASNQLPWIVNTLIKTKLVKNDAQAQKLLLVMVIIFTLVAITLFVIGLRTPEVNI